MPFRLRGASAAADVGTAVVRKILSPQSTGEECPRPGIVAFHLIFSVSLQRSGASVRAIPLSSGPRHFGHWPGSAAGISGQTAINNRHVEIRKTCPPSSRLSFDEVAIE